MVFFCLCDKRIECISQERNVGYIIDATCLQLQTSGLPKRGHSSCTYKYTVNRSISAFWIQVRARILHVCVAIICHCLQHDSLALLCMKYNN